MINAATIRYAVPKEFDDITRNIQVFMPKIHELMVKARQSCITETNDFLEYNDKTAIQDCLESIEIELNNSICLLKRLKEIK